MQTMTRIQAIREFFAEDGKLLPVSDMRGLTKEDRAELAELAAKEMGVEIITNKQ